MSQRMNNYINSSAVFVHQDKLIHEAVQEMVDKKISSLLIEDDHGHICGIITERDIVRKFTLLEVEDKLTRTVNTIMTRPVEFVSLKDFHKQIIKLHLERRIRHFPILSGTEPTRENLVGIVSITDVVRNYMTQELSKNPVKKDTDDTVQSGVSIGVLTQKRAFTNNYIEIFNGMGFNTFEVSDIHKFAMSPDAGKKALILDLDGFNDQQLHDLIPVAVKAKFYLIMTTSQPSLVPIFKKYIKEDHQEIAMKPIDLSYLGWILQRRWSIQNKP